MAIKDKRTGLTPKQECFAQALVTAPSATEAYRIAYNTENYTNEALWTQASLMANRPAVIKRVSAIRDRIARKLDLTVDDLIIELEEARQMAIEERQSSAMTGATMGKSKILGFDKVVVTGNDDAPITLIKRVIVDRVIDERVVESIASE